MEYRGVRIETCEGVYKPCDDTFMLADAMLEEVKSEDHVLDMGTGTGLIAILAASRARSASRRPASGASGRGGRRRRQLGESYLERLSPRVLARAVSLPRVVRDPLGQRGLGVLAGCLEAMLEPGEAR